MQAQAFENMWWCLKKRDRRGRETGAQAEAREGGRVLCVNSSPAVESEAEEEKVSTSVGWSLFSSHPKNVSICCQMENTLVFTSGANGRIKHSKLIKVRLGTPGRVTHACNPST